MFFEDVYEGYTFKTSTKPITGTEIDIVAQMSGMDLPAILNDEFAKSWGFKKRVAPGAYILACMLGLMAKQGFLSDAVWTAANNVSFKTPVYPGDQIHAEAEVIGLKELKGKGGLVTYTWTIKNQNDDVITKGQNT